jgi:shikimate kinase
MGPRRALRPLVAEQEPLEAVTGLLAARGALYQAAADLVVDTDDLDLQSVTRVVAEWISTFDGNSVMPAGR